MSYSTVAPEEPCEDEPSSPQTEMFCTDIQSLWKRSDNRYRVIKRNRLHPALRSVGSGTIDHVGIGIQRIGSTEEAERAADEIEARGSHTVEWPVREWLRRGRELGNEIYVVRERHSRSACGLIGYKREIEYESYGGVACVYASFDLSAIYIAPDYIGTGLATALFHPILSDVQSVIDHSINSVHILKKKCGARLAVSFYLTGEAQSSGGAACASSLQDAMLRAVRLSARNLRKGSSFLMEDPVIDLFDYGDEEMWRDYMIDELRTAA